MLLLITLNPQVHQGTLRVYIKNIQTILYKQRSKLRTEYFAFISGDYGGLAEVYVRKIRDNRG